MSTTSSDPEESIPSYAELPRFDLDFRFDDQDDPTEVTIFAPGTDEVTTHWITADVESAVSVDALR